MRDDEEIIALLHQRDEQVLDLIHKQYGTLCFQIAYRITGNREDAEECVNDMLMSVWNSIPPNRPAHLPAYCAALARNSALQKYEKSHRQKRGGSHSTEVIEELADILPSSESVEQRVEQNELSAALSAWVQTLSVESRRLFIQRYYMSESLQIIAARSNLTEEAVKSRLKRIRKKLKEYLIKEGLL